MQPIGLWRVSLTLSEQGWKSVVGVDDNAALKTSQFRFGRLPPLSLTALTAIVAALVVLLTIAFYGFSENGFRMGSQMAWRFAFFMFFAMLVAGPLCNLAPLRLWRYLGPQRRQLVWSFCAAFGVYLFSVFAPNAVLPLSLPHEGLTASMAVYLLFSGALAIVMAYAASPLATDLLGAKPQRAILAIAATTFWLGYTLTGLARVSGPHRPDLFYGISLCLMIVALLLRFADRFMVKFKSLA